MDTFRPFSLTHAAVIAAFAVIGSVLIVLRRRCNAAEGARLDRAAGLAAAVACVVTNGWPLLPAHFSLEWSLPLHGCDVTSMCVPIALLTNSRPARAVLYFWGLGLNTQGLVTPDLRDGPVRVGFWTFWLAHGAIVIGALYDVARGYRPTWRDYRLAVLASVAYVAVIMPLDLALGLNYGYIGSGTAGRPTIVDVLGPWPWRVGIMFVLACTAMALLMVPWEIARSSRGATLNRQSTTGGFSESAGGPVAGSSPRTPPA